MFIKHALILLIIFLVSFDCPAGNGSNDTIYINGLLKKSAELQRSNEDSSYKLATEAYSRSQNINFKKGIRGAFIRIGSIVFTRGNNDSALVIINEALSISQSLNDNKAASIACILLSYIYGSKGKQDSAFSLLYQAMRYSKIVNDSTNLMHINNALGDLNYSYHDYKSSIRYYSLAAKIAETIKNTDGALGAYMGIGNTNYKLEKFNDALKFYLKVDSISRVDDDIVTNAQNLNNIALCYSELKNYSLAKQYYKLALNEYINRKMSSEISNAYFNLANLYLRINNPDSAILLLEKSIVIARNIGELKEVADCYQLLANADSIKGNFYEAYKYQLKYTELSDSLLNADKISSISEMQTKYETEKKEAQIVILDGQNRTKMLQRNFFIAGMILFILLAGSIFIGLMKTSKEKKISETLLLNILPEEVADELKLKGSADAKLINQVTVLFTDFKGFTAMSEKLTPKELVRDIHECFSAFDHIMGKYGLEKIKTIGDAYMAAGGLPTPNNTHAQDSIHAALEIIEFIEEGKTRKITIGVPYFEIRIGIHTGPVVAGIVGVKKYSYDIWGDTVNIASRMESSGEVGKVNISGATYELVKNDFTCIHRGKIEAKGKGEIDMYFVNKS